MPNPRVAVVGVGIVGAAVARSLAARGATVTAVDAGRPGAGASAASLAWLNANQKLPRDYHDFSVRAMHEWRRLADSVGGPDWYAPTGNLEWGGGELADRVDRLRGWGYPAEHIGPERLRELEPALRVPGGATLAYFPAEGFVHTGAAVDALVSDARAHGAEVRAGVGTVALETSGGRVTAVRLSGGELIRADAYVCCAGWRTPELLAPHGATVPLVPGDAPGSTAPGLVTWIDAPSGLLGRVAHAPDLSLRPDGDGLRVDAEDVNDRVDAATPAADRARYADDLAARARRIVAGLPDRPRVRHQLCVRPLPVDGKPIVGWLPGLAGAYVVVCHSGVTLAALLGRLVADEVTGGCAPDLARYRVDRFG